MPVQISGVAPSPTGNTIARARRTTSTASSTSTTPVAIQRLAAPVIAGRLYRVKCPNVMFSNTAAALTSLHVAVATLRITTDGSAPSQSSTLLDQAHLHMPSGMPLATPLALDIEAIYAATFTGTLTVLQSFYAGVGTQGLSAVANTAYPLDLVIEDAGVDPTATGVSL
jgi:hypothetical protein